MVTLSVLIPTRNNPHSCLKAIKYSILQINKNIEIVVSDNSDGKYQGVLKQLLQDSNLLSSITLYEQNKILTMPENWQFLLNNSHGSYFTVLPDRWAPEKVVSI